MQHTNVTKTTASTNAKQSMQRAGNNSSAEDINVRQVNVGLPKINSKKNQLAAIDDDDYEDDYDERMPAKPKNIRRTPSQEETSDLL